MKNLFILLTLSLTLGTASAALADKEPRAVYVLDTNTGNMFEAHKVGGNDDGRGLPH